MNFFICIAWGEEGHLSKSLLVISSGKCNMLGKHMQLYGNIKYNIIENKKLCGESGVFEAKYMVCLEQYILAFKHFNL